MKRGLLPLILFLIPFTAAGEDSRLRRFEDKAAETGGKRLLTPEEAKSADEEAETDQRRERFEAEWAKRHPGEPVPQTCDSGEDVLSEVFGEVILRPLLELVVSMPFSIPRRMIGAPEDRPLYFESYPFESSKLFRVNDGVSPWKVSADVSHQWTQGSVEGTAATAELFNTSGWGGRLSHLRYEEKQPRVRESLQFTEAVGFYNFAQNRSTHFRVGAGAERMAGERERIGGKLLYGIGVFGKPLDAGVDASLTVGLGNSPLREVVYHAGFHCRRLAFIFRYRYMAVKHEELRGPELGLQWWF